MPLFIEREGGKEIERERETESECVYTGTGNLASKFISLQTKRSHIWAW